MLVVLALYCMLRYRSYGQQLELSKEFGGTAFMIDQGLTLTRYVIVPTAARTLQGIVLAIVISLAVRFVKGRDLHGSGSGR